VLIKKPSKKEQTIVIAVRDIRQRRKGVIRRV